MDSIRYAVATAQGAQEIAVVCIVVVVVLARYRDAMLALEHDVDRGSFARHKGG